MIDLLRYTAQFCFWLFWALVFASLAAIGLWVVVEIVKELKKEKK